MPKVATASRNSDTIEADDHKVKFETTCDVVFPQKTGSWPKLHVPCGYYVRFNYDPRAVRPEGHNELSTLVMWHL